MTDPSGAHRRLADALDVTPDPERRGPTTEEQHRTTGQKFAEAVRDQLEDTPLRQHLQAVFSHTDNHDTDSTTDTEEN